MTKAQEMAFQQGQIIGLRNAGSTVLKKAVDYFVAPEGGRMEVREVAYLFKALAVDIGRYADALERVIPGDSSGAK